MLALAGVLLLLSAAEITRELADAEPGQDVILDLVYAVAEALLGAYIVAAVALVVGAMVYLYALPPRRQDRLPRSDLHLGGGARGSGRGPRGVPILSMLGGTRPALGLLA